MQRPSEEQKRSFAGDGFYKAEQFLTQDQMALARTCFDFVRANPSKRAFVVFPGTEHEHHIDDTHPRSWKAGLQELVQEAGVADYLADLWGSEHVWYFGDEYFTKEGGRVGNSPWHQDHSVIPFVGDHWANLWISFEPLPAHNSLSMIRGSHKGKLYNGAAYTDPDDPTKPLHPNSDFERLPDIDAELARDPSSWDLASFETRPGDVIFVHPSSLHGRAPVDETTPDRHTLVLRFFGDKTVYNKLPNTDWSFMESQETGAPFRSSRFIQLR